MKVGNVDMLRTGLPLQESPVFRSAYFPETVHRTVSSKTLDLQGFAPSNSLCTEPSAQVIPGIVHRSPTLQPAEGRQLPAPHRNSPSDCSGVPVGFIYLRTESVLWTAPVFRMAYSPATVHRTVPSETLMLQGCAPP